MASDTAQAEAPTGSRELVYDAVLFGLGAALGDLASSDVGARLAEELHKSIGRHLAEYLRARGVTYEAAADPEETVKNVLTMFLEQLDFAELEETEQTPERGTHASWRRILGLKAYAELEKRYPDPFLSCPLNAVIRSELEATGHTLKVHGCASDLAGGLLESWEAVIPGTHFLAGDDTA